MARKNRKNKKAYYKRLRQQWLKSKKLAKNDKVAKALHREVQKTLSGKFSYNSFYFALLQMRAKKLDGVPYIDCKTYKGWKKSGYYVRRDEEHVIDGLVWIHPVTKDESGDEVEDEKAVYPVVYYLFHKSQVNPA